MTRLIRYVGVFASAGACCLLLSLPRLRAAASQNAAVPAVAAADGDDEAADEQDSDEKDGVEAGEEQERVFQFSEADLGKVPPGWEAAKTGSGEGCHWRIVPDATSPSGTGQVLAQTAKSPGRMFNLCVIGDTNYRDVEVEVCFKAVEGRVDQGGGIVWRYQDANNYYVARMNPLEDNYRLYKVVDGKRTQLATKEGLKVPAGEWHTLEIVQRGNKIRCELDDKRVLEFEDDTFQNAGKVGLWTKADARTYFDNFEVEGK